MAKISITAKTFNNLIINPVVDVFINYGKKNTVLPVRIYNQTKERIKKEFNVKEFEFEIISKDLEILMENGIEIIWDDFIEKIIELAKNINKEIENSGLKRAYNFYKENKTEKAENIFKSINEENLSQFDKKEYKFLEFLLDKNKNSEKFEKYIKIFEDNPAKLKEIYFNFIKFLQNKRDESLPRYFIKQFEETFPLSYLTDKEKSIYYYLKGRGLYYRGEFIEAIINLKKSKQYANDEELLSDIYNTTANIFTDNLYFKEALYLAEKALEIREKLYLEEKINDTFSLIGGIYLKQNKLANSYKFFNKVKRENSRINNYRAKTAILRGYFNKAEEYIKKAKEFEKNETVYDRKGFLRSIEIFYLFKRGKFNEAEEFFKKEFEESRNIDAIVWGSVCAVMSEIYFKRNKIEEVYKILFKGIDELLKDNYILEAYYLSLYPYKFEMAKKDIEEFNNQTADFNLTVKLAEYVNRHIEILSKEAEEFGIKTKGKELEKFSRKLINRENVFDKFNLL